MRILTEDEFKANLNNSCSLQAIVTVRCEEGQRYYVELESENTLRERVSKLLEENQINPNEYSVEYIFKTSQDIK